MPSVFHSLSSQTVNTLHTARAAADRYRVNNMTIGSLGLDVLAVAFGTLKTGSYIGFSMITGVLLATHADRQSVDMPFTVCLCVCVCVCVCVFVRLRIFPLRIKLASDVKFCTVVHRHPGTGISHFGELCSFRSSPRSPKSDESASLLIDGRTCLFL